LSRTLTAAALTGLLALAACGGGEENQATNGQVESEPVRASADRLPAGTTPMAERVAVIGLLNKRNGIARDLTLRPGQAVRDNDIIIRLRACETTAPHEPQQLTGAFVQVDTADRQGQFRRIFSGWLYKESPSLNVVEHPVYDVWVKSCAMTHPGGPPAPEAPADSSSNRSSLPKSGSARAPERPAATSDDEPNAPAASNSAVNISR
jgi:hypothetical protein